jgi:hypothetical protein
MQEHYIEGKIDSLHDWDTDILEKIKDQRKADALIRAIENEISSITSAFKIRISDRVANMIRTELLK